MIIENLNGLTVLHAEGNNKITNSERSFFTDMIYLGKNDGTENYQEVTSDIWKHYIGQISQSDADVINENLNQVKNNVYTLEDILIDTDFRLMVLEMEKEYGEM